MANQQGKSATGEIPDAGSRQGDLCDEKRGSEKTRAEPAEGRRRPLASEQRLEQDTRQRKEAEEKLAECFRFQRLLFDISTGFLTVSHNRIDSEIQIALKRILELFRADRCGLTQIMRDGTSYQIPCAASRDGLPGIPVKVDLPVARSPWLFKRIVEFHEVYNYASLDEMPAEAGIDRKSYEEWGIRSVLNVPITVDGTLEYVLSLTSDCRERVLPQEYISQLRMLGEIIVRSLQLSRAKRRLEKRQKFEKLVTDISSGFVTGAPDGLDSAIDNWLRKISEFFDADRCILRMLSKDETTLGRPLSGSSKKRWANDSTAFRKRTWKT